MAWSSHTRRVIVHRFAAAVAMLALSFCTPAFASWAMIPLPDRLRDASAVVVGEVIDVTPGPEIGNRPQKLAVVTVKEVLKFPPGVTDATDERVKTIKIAFPDTEGKVDPKTGQVQMMVASTDIAYRKGQSGVWTLTKSPAGDFYIGGTPWSLMDASEVDRVKQTLTVIGKEPWGEASHGLAVQLLVHRAITGKPELPVAPVVVPGAKPGATPVKTVVPGAKPVDGDSGAKGEPVRAKNVEDDPSWSAEPAAQKGTVMIAIYLKNTTKDRLLRVSNHVGDKAVTLKRTAVDGSTLDIDLYDFLKRARLRAPGKDDFFELQPGETKRFGTFSLADFAPEGKVKLDVTFTTKRDGRDVGVMQVWTGSATANAVGFDYTPEKAPAKVEGGKGQ